MQHVQERAAMNKKPKNKKKKWINRDQIW
jgi:hypothetical protein